MRVRVVVVAALLFCPALAQDRSSRDAEIVRTSDLGTIIDQIAKAVDDAGEKPGEKVLVAWMIDNNSSLKSSRHHELLSEHIARAFAKQKAGVHHAVLSFAERPQLVLKATADPRAPGRAIQWLAEQKADDTIKNCCENIRAGAQYAGGFSGKKFLVVYTPVNGDNEDEVEATLKMLKSTGVVLHTIADEAIYSDPYWEALLYSTGTVFYGDTQKWKKLKFQMAGPDSAYIEFPHGWMLSTGDPTYTVPSGWGYWALNRLSTHSNGRYYLYSPESASTSFCQRWACAVCAGQHKACGAIYDPVKLKMTAPSIEARDAVREKMSRDRIAVEIYEAWQKLFRLGLVRNSASLKASGGGLAPAKPQYSSNNPLTFGNSWRGGANVCRQLAVDLDRIIAEFEATIEKLAGPDAEKRSFATADALAVHMRLLRVNLNQLRYFCEEIDEHERKKHEPDTGFGAESFGDS